MDTYEIKPVVVDYVPVFVSIKEMQDERKENEEEYDLTELMASNLLQVKNKKLISKPRRKKIILEQEEEQEEEEKPDLGGNTAITKDDLIDIRKKDFANQLVFFLGQYSKEMIREFYEYWIEPNKSKTKMRFELEKTWDLNLRLKKWERNSFGKKKEVVKANQPYL